jgi:N-acetylmuramoyl-L-alanine amidase
MKPTRIILHCSATPNGQTVPIETIRKWHTTPPPTGRGWKDVGYHAVFQPDGTIERGRGYDEQGAGVEGENESSLHFCFIGDTQFTSAQLAAGRRHIEDVCRIYDIRPWRIFGHYQFKSAQAQGKTCPNMEINRLIAWLVGHYEEAIWPYLMK